MSIPSIPTLEAAAKKLVWAARKNDTLSTLTPRVIRQKLETELALDAGFLDASNYKSAIKAATRYALDNEPPPFEEKLPEQSPKVPPTNKRKNMGRPAKSEEVAATLPSPQTSPPGKPRASRGKGRAIPVVMTEDENDGEEDEGQPTPKKRKVVARARKHASDDDDDDGEDYVEEEESPKRKAKPRTAKPKSKTLIATDEEEDDEAAPTEVIPAKSKAGSAKAKKDTKFKSLEHVPTSDMEQDEPEPLAGPSSAKPSNAVPVSAKSKPTAPIKPKPATPAKKSVSTSLGLDDVEMDGADVDAPAKSDSELSVLIDEPPKRKRKSTTGDKAAKPKAKRASKSSGAELSKDEETIKRLKSLVVACGTRKVWSKVFQGIDSPQQQIKKLKGMLAELGMTGRLSMEQAKAIKEKRELEQELADVTEFAAKVTAPKGRHSSKTASVEPDDEDKDASESNPEDEDDEEVAAPRKRGMNARKSIMAFLDDQSDED